MQGDGGGVADGADGLCQPVEVMESLVVALEGGHVFRPGGEYQQSAISTGLEAAALGLPVLTDGFGLDVYQSQFLLQCHVLYSLLTLGDAGSDQHIATLGSGDKTDTFILPVVGVFCWNAIGLTVEEDLVFLGLA